VAADAPVSVSSEAMTTDVPGAVVPLTVVLPPSIVEPEAGAVSVTVVAAGAPCVT